MVSIVDSAGYPGLGCSTSPSWYQALNEMIMLLRFVESSGLAQDYERFCVDQWPLVKQQIEECNKMNPHDGGFDYRQIRRIRKAKETK